MSNPDRHRLRGERETTVLRPDIAIVCNNEGEKIITTPKVVIEVVSPSSKEMDERIKLKVYATKSLEYYFLAYPERKEIKGFVLKRGNLRTFGPRRGRFRSKTKQKL